MSNDVESAGVMMWSTYKAGGQALQVLDLSHQICPLPHQQLSWIQAVWGKTKTGSL